MTKNKIQFQKGLSLPRFLSQYDTEEQCREALCKMRWHQGFRCPKCGLLTIAKSVTAKCTNVTSVIFRQASLIQGTLFAATKPPLTAWLSGIYPSPGKDEDGLLQG